MKKLAIAAAAVVLLIILYSLFLSGPEVVNRNPSGETIVCFGDSLTAGTGAPPELSYPAQLEKLVGEPVINAGVPGDTTASALARLDSDVLAHSPRIVLITLGGNDLMGGVEPEDAFSRLATIVYRIQERGALVVVGGVEPPIHGRGYPEAYQQLARETGCVLVDNVLAGIMGKDEFMSDRIHPNQHGYARMAERFHKAVKPYL
jgi:lysophospholipase L1-like esterase